MCREIFFDLSRELRNNENRYRLLFRTKQYNCGKIGRRGEKTRKERKDVLSPVYFSFSPLFSLLLPLPSFFHFSVSLMKPLNASSKRISFLGRSHFHLEKENCPCPGLSLFRATKKYRHADETGCRFKSAKLYYPSQLRENCAVNSDVQRKTIKGVEWRLREQVSVSLSPFQI